MTAKQVFFQEQPESLEAAFKARSTRNYQGRFFKGLKFESQSASGFGACWVRSALGFQLAQSVLIPLLY